MDETPFVYPVADYYRTDPISRASPTMAECSETFGGHARDKAADRHAWVSRIMNDFWWGYGWPTAIVAIEVLIVVVPLLLAIAYYTYAERKVLAFSQLRKGPNVVGPFGLLQPIADGLKMLVKETIIPSGANRLVFIAAPMLTFTLALVAWAVIPFDSGVVIANINVGILYLFAISSLVGLRHHHGGLGVEFALCVSRRLARRGADGVVRGLDRLRAGDGAALRRLAEPERDRAGAAHDLVRDPASADGGDLLHLRAGRDEPRAVRSGRKANRRSSPGISSNIRRCRSRCSISANTAT